MKKKVFNKKLSLNKETVSKLNQSEMGDVKGGGSDSKTDYTCDPNGCVGWKTLSKGCEPLETAITCDPNGCVGQVTLSVGCEPL